jgi:DNA-binding HxlR family transcriptional regulator
MEEARKATVTYRCVSRYGRVKCYLSFASDHDNVWNLSVKSKPKRRSGCPVSISLEVLGDRWTLLIIRDLMVRGSQTFKEFREGGEKIATNVLAERLRRLEQTGIIAAKVEKTDGRRINYRLTEKGIDLAPLLLELLIWGARHEETGAPAAVIRKLEKNSQEFLAEVRRRWQQGDMTPALPKFGESGASRKLRRE